MRDYKSLSYTRWDCKYHIVFIPKNRKKVIYGQLRKYFEEIFHELSKRKGVVIEEGYLMVDQVHICVSAYRRSMQYPMWSDILIVAKVYSVKTAPFGSAQGATL